MNPSPGYDEDYAEYLRLIIMGTGKMDSSAVYALFEELKTIIVPLSEKVGLLQTEMI